jgi:long-chain acyl-CoA synthetase
MSNYFYDMIPAAEMAQLHYIPTVPAFLDWITTQWAERPALSDTVNTYSYAQMSERIACRRTLLQDLGLQKGDHVAIFDKNSVDAVESFLAVTSAGMVAVMLPAQLPAPAVIGCCAKFRAKALVVRDEFKQAVQGAPCPLISASELAQTPTPAAVVDKEEPAAIFFTGGTTGAPKGAVLPHRALMRGAFNGCFAPGSQLFGHVTIGFLPLTHVFGLIAGTLGKLMVGALWYSAEDMKATIGKLPVIRPTVLVLVPGLVEVLVGLTKMYGPQFLGGRLKTIISGAANVPPKLMEEFKQFNISVLAGYGMTEGANLTSGNADTDTRPTSVGKIYPEQEVKLVDGEIWFRGDNVFLGYYGDPEQTAATLTEDGWLKTGDLGRFDEDGFLYIVGRIKNIIVLPSGENISPESIEEPFYQYPAVRDCLVKEDVSGGQGVLAIEILPRPEAVDGKTPEEVEAYFKQVVEEVNATLPSTHRVAKFSIRKEDFKRTGSLKVSRNQN